MTHNWTVKLGKDLWTDPLQTLLTRSKTESCDEDDGAVGEGAVEEELAEKPGTTNGS